MTSTISPITASLEKLKEFLLKLIVENAYKEGDFTLSSGQKSSYYINCKQVTLDAKGAIALGRLILSILPKDTEAVAGLTLGADPIVSAVSVVSAYENLNIPALIIRKKAKGHGTQAYIEGISLQKGAKVVVLEDVVTTGQSALIAVQRLQDVGYKVEEVIALVDRKQGGGELYKSKGLKFSSLFSIEDLQKKYKANQS